MRQGPTASAIRASAARAACHAARLRALRALPGEDDGRPGRGGRPCQISASSVTISRCGNESGAEPSAFVASNSWIGAPGITVLIACL